MLIAAAGPGGGDQLAIAQSERRVLNGEAVPAGEKLVSLFEPHGCAGPA
jgi:hypothetical protein